MKKRSRILNVLEKIADPFLVLGVFALFLIPALTVLNLTPIKLVRESDDNVLGVEESTVVTIEENIEEEDGISIVDYNQTDDNTHKFRIKHLTHSSGEYENLIFSAQNHSDKRRVLKVTSSHEITDPGTEVFLSDGNKEYVLLKEDGTIYPANIYIEPEEKLKISLTVHSPLDINFTSYLNLSVFVE